MQGVGVYTNPITGNMYYRGQYVVIDTFLSYMLYTVSCLFGVCWMPGSTG
ncbi:hypothetical protein LINPERPRIM_LOCUS29377 [Linum perenne]